MKDSVTQFYNKNSQNRYENRGTIEDVTDSYVAIIDDFLDNIPKNGRILDCGCGVGRDMRYMLNHQTRVNPIGLDISHEQLQYAPQPKIQADMTTLCFPNNTFNGLWLPNSIFFLPENEIPTALNELSRVITETGTLAIGFKIRDNTQQLTMERWGDSTPYMVFTQSDAKQLVQNAEFNIQDEYLNKIDEERTFLTLFCTLE